MLKSKRTDLRGQANINMNKKTNEILQSIISDKKPFDIYNNSIRFESKNGPGLRVNMETTSAKTMFAIKDTLNSAYQYGFADGVNKTLEIVNNAISSRHLLSKEEQMETMQRILKKS